MSKLVEFNYENVQWIALQEPLPLLGGYPAIPTDIPVVLWDIDSKNRGWVGYPVRPPLMGVEKNLNGTFALPPKDAEWLKYGPALGIFKVKLSSLRRCSRLTRLPTPLRAGRNNE